jgi:hypothetical protein
LLLLPLGMAAQTTQTKPDDGSLPAPKGQVLFERHEALPVDTEPAPAAPAPSTGGVSSSQGKAGLKRRSMPADDPEVQDSKPFEPVQRASSSADADASADGPILISVADIQASKKVTDEARRAVQVVGTTMDLHLNSHTGAAEIRAQILVKNDGPAPLPAVILRVSGALRWESGRISGGSALTFEQHRVADDLDHTGVGSEIVATLPQPLAPGATVSLDLYYGGVLEASTQRLVAMGAPVGRAGLTDWDTVSDTFTGLRGMGNVLWYPVAQPPALLRDGSAVPKAVEAARIRNAGSSFALHLSLEFEGVRPEAAYFCGERALLKPLGNSGADEGGVVVADWKRATLGPRTPSLFVAQAMPQEVAGGLLRVVTDRADAAAAVGEAAAKVRPMLAEWLGAAPLRPLDVIDLAVPGASGFADGSLLVAPLTTGPAASLAPALVGPLAASWMPANLAAPWLRDGLPAFLQAVWAERTEGREAALGGLAASRNALTMVDAPAASSSSSSSSPVPEAVAGGALVATCGDPACARAKAAYVFEMLRDMLGDTALQQALSGWRVAVEKMPPQQTAADETAALESLLQRVAGKRNLQWFFANWIDADKGLPELSIVTVAPRKVERDAPTNYLPPVQPVGGPIGPEPVPKPGDPESVAPKPVTPGNRIAPASGSWMVAVEVQNAGGADAEVPVTVRAGDLTNTLPLRVPAHGKATIRVPFEAVPEEVLVNDGSVPEVRTSTHRRSLDGIGR